MNNPFGPQARNSKTGALLPGAVVKVVAMQFTHMTDAVVYKLYSLRPLSTAANQQLPVTTYFGNLAPPCGCLHAVVH